MRTLESNITDKAYSLVQNGEVIINSNHLKLLQEALTDLRQGRETFIHYNETGVKVYEAERGLS